MRTVRSRRLAAIVIIAAIAGGTFWLVEYNVRKGLAWSVAFAALATLVVTILVPAIAPLRTLAGWVRGALPLSDTTLARAREDLARALATSWAEEERLRRINDPWPLPVRWSGAGAGQYTEIGEAFAGLTPRRLVVLGPAGAGKTALAIKLVRELLRLRQPGDPVPVLLSAATWTDPCTMPEWIAGRLALDHPGLAADVRTGTGDTVPLPRTLAASEVLPVIDGLDELPEVRRAQVVKEINAYGSDRPLVLTCRPAEYVAATAARPVALASVISLDPLAPADVRAYLEAATDAPHDRWQRVFEACDAAGPSALREVLTNPLMLWLARTVFERGDTTPGELADLAGRDAIEGHLLAGFVPAAYASRNPGHRFRCSPAQAQRWLGFLAAWQDRFGGQDIAWWRLCRVERGWSVVMCAIRAALVTCVAWLAVTWALTRRGYWRGGGYTGREHYSELLAGPLGRTVRGLIKEPAAWDGHVHSFLRSVATFGLPATAGLAVALGLLYGLATMNSAPVPLTPRIALSRIRGTAVPLTVLFVIVAGIWWVTRKHPEAITVIAPERRTQLLLVFLGVSIAYSVVNDLAVPVDVSAAAGPADLIRRARRVYLLRFVAEPLEVLIVWLWLGTVFAVAVGAAAAVIYAGTAMLGNSGGSAWPRFREARFRLALRRRLPWRTVSFLADAHRRGVLRQAGAVYQFRHIRLQEQLATGYSLWPPLLDPLAGWVRIVFATAANLTRQKIAEWRSDPQTVVVGADEISGVITPRSGWSSVRHELLHYAVVALIGTAVVGLLAAAITWVATLVVVFGTGLALAMAGMVRLRGHRVGAGVVPSSWTLKLTADEITVTQDNSRARVRLADVESVTTSRVRAPDGASTDWTALQAQLSPGISLPFSLHNGWLPLVWISPHGDSEELSAVVRWFPDKLVSPSDRGRKRRYAIEYEASGEAPAEPAVPLRAMVALLAAGLLLLLWQTDVATFFLLCWAVVLAICVVRLSKRAAIRALPTAAWAVRIAPDGIEVEIGGAVSRLAPGDIAEAELNTLRDRRGRRTLYSCVQVRPQRGITAAGLTREGWLPLYSKLVPTLTPLELPAEMLSALLGVAGQRFGSRLTQAARSALGRRRVSRR